MSFMCSNKSSQSDSWLCAADEICEPDTRGLTRGQGLENTVWSQMMKQRISESHRSECESKRCSCCCGGLNYDETSQNILKPKHSKNVCFEFLSRKKIPQTNKQKIMYSEPQETLRCVFIDCM